MRYDFFICSHRVRHLTADNSVSFQLQSFQNWRRYAGSESNGISHHSPHSPVQKVSLYPPCFSFWIAGSSSCSTGRPLMSLLCFKKVFTKGVTHHGLKTEQHVENGHWGMANRKILMLNGFYIEIYSYAYCPLCLIINKKTLPYTTSLLLTAATSLPHSPSALSYTFPTSPGYPHCTPPPPAPFPTSL